MSRVARVVSTRAALTAQLDATDRQSLRAVVPTMGALHDGHATLIEKAREYVGDSGVVTVTIFVNPTQFAANEDFDRYPRSLQADVDVCVRHGADLVFAPEVAQMYPDGATQVTVDPGPLGSVFEGAVRPGHFQGVLTVVNKLFNMTQADVGFFGEKDYQQLVLIRQMARDLSMGVEVIGVPTVREVDGLAMSSRNRYLSGHDRVQADVVPKAMKVGADVADAGGSAGDIVTSVEKVFTASGIDVDYIAVTDPDLGAAPISGEARLIVAVRVGSVRLLDNTSLQLGARP
jgi:pantoate--beta-alanine ligase